MMTDSEREQLANQLLAIVFSLRPPEPEKGQAWALLTMSTALARAIVASIGPTADPEPLLELAAEEVRKLVQHTQSTFIQGALKQGVPRGRCRIERRAQRG